MDILVQKLNQSIKPTQTLVIFTYTTQAKGKKDKTKVHISGTDKTVSSLISDTAATDELTGAKNESIFFRNSNLGGYKNLLSIGLGDSKKINEETLRQAGAAAFKALTANKQKNASFNVESLTKNVKNSSSGVQAAVEGVQLAEYDFDNEKTKDNKTKRPLEKIVFLVGSRGNIASIKKAVKTANTVSECVNFSRYLGDNPGNLMTPKILAEEVQKAAKNTKLKVTVWDKARIKKEKMGGLYGVSLGSGNDPRFIIMEYKGAPASKKPVCFVGKGLTFDSGGISIKPASGMDEMKYDMCGGANVIGAMLAIAKLNLKINVLGLVPSSENMTGPFATKPGDILRARNGKTVEVLNTDAEGRLILMDALSYASEKKPKVIFDAATLTGAVVVALGNSFTGTFTRDDSLQKKILDASKKSGELVWPMPIHDHHVNDMKGLHADLSNISSFRGAGSSTAAAFLEQFVDKDIPWAHFDIAGTAWAVENRLNYCPKKGASGAMVRTFVELAQIV